MADTNIEVKENKVTRWLAVIGLAVAVVVLAYLAIQLVRLLPTAFATLANLFEENQRELSERLGGDDENDENVVVVRNDEEDDEDIEVTEEDDEPADVAVVATSTSSSPVASKPAAPAPVQYKTVVTYKLPVSDPNGYTDLEAAFAAVGQMTVDGRFSATGYLEEDEANAIQFKVRNIGTKTSAGWRFEAELPNGERVSSKVQRPLNPGEMSTLTLVFPMNDRKAKSFTISVSGGNDVNRANDSFTVRSMNVK